MAELADATDSKSVLPDHQGKTAQGVTETPGFDLPSGLPLALYDRQFILVIEAWPELHETIKAGIVAMVKADADSAVGR